jgi:hypothetical protein
MTFLTKITKTELKLATEYGSLCKMLQKNQNYAVEGDASKVLLAWGNLAEKFFSEIKNTNYHIDNLVIARTKLLHAEITKKLRNFDRDVHVLCKRVNNERTKTLECIRSHEMFLNSKKYGDSINDPWLSEKSLNNEVNIMVGEENNFQDGMNNLFQEVSIFDW